MIKLTKILFALSLLVMLTACGSDDDGPETGDLIGTWEVVTYEGQVESSTVFNGTTTESEVDFTGSNLAYTVTFTGTAWTTNGGYDMTINSSVNGMAPNSSVSNVSGATGTGTYSTNGNIMTIDGSFFEFESNGVPVVAANGPQMAEFEINSDGELVFSQDESTETTQSGVATSTTIKSTSVWKKQ